MLQEVIWSTYNPTQLKGCAHPPKLKKQLEHGRASNTEEYKGPSLQMNYGF